VILEPKISDDVPFPLLEVIVRTAKEFGFFCVDNNRWCKGFEDTKRRIHKYVLIVLERIVFFYKANKWTVGKLRPHVDYSMVDAVKFGNVPFLNNVATAILTELKMHDGFEFDPVQSLRYLNFKNGCWDRDADALVPTRPDMYITHCTGWSYQDFQHPELDSLDAALERVRREQGQDLSREYTMSPELEDEFTRIAATMPELQVYYEWLDDWATVVYVLQHETRAVFGKPMAEHLVIRSQRARRQGHLCGQDRLRDRHQLPHRRVS